MQLTLPSLSTTVTRPSCTAFTRELSTSLMPERAKRSAERGKLLASVVRSSWGSASCAAGAPPDQHPCAAWTAANAVSCLVLTTLDLFWEGAQQPWS